VLLGLVTILMVEQGLAWWFGTPGHAARRRRRWGAVFLRKTAGAGPGRYRSVRRAK